MDGGGGGVEDKEQKKGTGENKTKNQYQMTCRAFLYTWIHVQSQEILRIK